MLSVQASPDRGCAYWVFGFRGERTSSGLADGIQDVSGSSGMIRCVWEWCSPLRECYRWIGKTWDGFGFGQGVFRWGLNCEWTQVGVTRLGWDVTVVTVSPL